LDVGFGEDELRRWDVNFQVVVKPVGVTLGAGHASLLKGSFLGHHSESCIHDGRGAGVQDALRQRVLCRGALPASRHRHPLQNRRRSNWGVGRRPGLCNVHICQARQERLSDGPSRAEATSSCLAASSRVCRCSSPSTSPVSQCLSFIGSTHVTVSDWF
jgi:hypothetical protein